MPRAACRLCFRYFAYVTFLRYYEDMLTDTLRLRRQPFSLYTFAAMSIDLPPRYADASMRHVFIVYHAHHTTEFTPLIADMPLPPLLCLHVRHAVASVTFAIAGAADAATTLIPPLSSRHRRRAIA